MRPRRRGSGSAAATRTRPMRRRGAPWRRCAPRPTVPWRLRPRRAAHLPRGPRRHPRPAPRAPGSRAGRVDAVRGDGVVHAPRAAAGPAGHAAVGCEELGHARPRARKPLAVRLGRDAERVGCGAAVHLEHGAQHERAAPLHIQALQHAVHARHLQLAFQQAPVRAAGQVGHVALATRGDVLSIYVEAHGPLGEQALAVGGQMVERGAEHPGGKRALAAEPGQARARLHQYLLRGVLGVGHGAQHAQRQVEHPVLHARQQLAQGFLVPCERGVDQCVLVGHAVPLSFSPSGRDTGRCAGPVRPRRARPRPLVHWTLLRPRV